uniref:Glutathione transferase n=1 Tax=Cyprinus carpio TaxID=7962 RepID=A0A8C1JVD1_CYPCA
MAESQKCLGKGSPAPGPVPKKHIQLYSMRFCPFAQWTRLVMSMTLHEYNHFKNIWKTLFLAQQKMLMNGCSFQVTPYFYKTPVSKTKGEDVLIKEKLTLVNKKTKMEMMDLNNTHADNFFILSSCLDGTPQLKKWTEHMLEDPPVKATVFSTDNYKVFYKSYMEGTPDYDYGL